MTNMRYEQVQSLCVCVRKQDYHVFGNLEFDAETALLNAFMFKQISRSCSEIQGGRLTSKCKLSFNKRSPKSGWQGQTPLRPFIVYSFHLHNWEIGAGGFTFKQFRIRMILEVFPGCMRRQSWFPTRLDCPSFVGKTSLAPGSTPSGFTA